MPRKSAAQIDGVNNKSGAMINKLSHKEILFLIFSPFPAEIVLFNTIPLKDEENSKAIFNPPGAYHMGTFWENQWEICLHFPNQVVDFCCWFPFEMKAGFSLSIIT
jgi:hypothetical protein